MSAEVDAELASGLLSLLPHVPGYAALGGLAVWMFRFGKRIGLLEADLQAGTDAAVEGKAAQKASEERIGALEVKVAAIPTRDEMRDMFAEVRTDIRDLRSAVADSRHSPEPPPRPRRPPKP